MQRRDFLKVGSTVGMGLAASTAVAQNTDGGTDAPTKHQFKLKYAPHFGMFQNLAGGDLVDQLKFAADQGFTAWEDNGMKNRSVADQERCAQAMDDLGMTMGVFVASFARGDTFTGRNKDLKQKFLDDLKSSVEVAKRVNAKWMTVVPGNYVNNLEWGYQTANCVELLKRGAEVFEPHGLVMVLEPLNWWRDHGGVFLHKIPQAFEICKAVDSPAVKILFDIYHQQIQEGNLIPNIDMSWSEIGYFQCGDNPGRKEPGTGEINYRNVFKHIHAKGFEGIMGLEHGNSKGGKEGDQAVIDSYVDADNF